LQIRAKNYKVIPVKIEPSKSIFSEAIVITYDECSRYGKISNVLFLDTIYYAIASRCHRFLIYNGIFKFFFYKVSCNNVIYLPERRIHEYNLWQCSAQKLSKIEFIVVKNTKSYGKTEFLKYDNNYIII